MRADDVLAASPSARRLRRRDPVPGGVSGGSSEAPRGNYALSMLIGVVTLLGFLLWPR